MSFKQFSDGGTLAQWLAQEVGSLLQTAIDAKGKASLAVSGGSTPEAFFTALSGQGIEWEKVTVTLVDERWVPSKSARSNARLVSERLLQNKAERASFVPLFRDDFEPSSIMRVEDEISALMPFDVIILGMGTDGHTASFFPGADNLDEAASLDTGRLLVDIRAENAGEPRVTLSLPVIAGAKNVFLHIEGGEKLTVYETAKQGGDPNLLPVRHVMQACKDLQTIYAP